MEDFTGEYRYLSLGVTCMKQKVFFSRHWRLTLEIKLVVIHIVVDAEGQK